MTLLIYTVVGLASTWLLYIGYVHLVTRASEGRSSASLAAVFPQLETQSGCTLIYCFAPQCRPCLPMSREVDQLEAEGLPICRLDVQQHPDLAREYGIRATPTLIVVDNGVVSRMVLGVKTAGFMRRLIGPERT